MVIEHYRLPPEVGFKTGQRGFLPDRPTLILIHGAGGQAQNFLPQLRFLDRHLNILALDLPGHGRTPGPGLESITECAEWVRRSLEGLPGESFFLGGHSMGGAVCLEIGLRYPKGPAGIILIASSARFGVSPKILEGLRTDPRATLVRINQWCYPKGTDPVLIAQAVRMMEQTPAPVILKDFLACNRYDCSDDLDKLAIPALILVGDQDVMTPPDSSRFLQGKMPFSRLTVIPGAGHMVMLERPREVNQAILEFIRKSRCRKNPGSAKSF
jgi:pimeloyl-ACP methyl ester carboxylesterase